MAEWGFYGRRQERAQLAQVLSRGRWFFLQISGRRRIGKTRLVQELLQPQRQERVLYIQIPDSDPAGVVSTARDFMENFRVSGPIPHDLRSLAVCIGELCAGGDDAAAAGEQAVDDQLLLAAQNALGAAMLSLGPETVLAALPLNLVEGLAGTAEPRTWLLPLLRIHVRSARLGYWGKVLLPLARELGTRAAAAARWVGMLAGLLLTAALHA